MSKQKGFSFLQPAVAYKSYRLIICLTRRLIGCSISLWRNQVDQGADDVSVMSSQSFEATQNHNTNPVLLTGPVETKKISGGGGLLSCITARRDHRLFILSPFTHVVIISVLKVPHSAKFTAEVPVSLLPRELQQSEMSATNKETALTG